MPRETRKVTCKLLEMMDDGLIDPKKLAQAALNYMSEADVADLASSEGYIEDEEDDEPITSDERAANVRQRRRIEGGT